jgi:polyhydroxyalkanoate synthesis regulator phasin
MPTPNKEWIKEFDEKLVKGDFTYVDGEINEDDVKSFIQTLLDKAEAKSFKEGQERVREWAEKTLKMLEDANQTKELNDDYVDGVEKTIEKLLSELKKD